MWLTVGEADAQSGACLCRLRALYCTDLPTSDFTEPKGEKRINSNYRMSGSNKLSNYGSTRYANQSNE